VCTNCEEAGFELSTASAEVAACAPQPGQFDVAVESLQAFTSPVTLSVTPNFSGGPALSISPTSVTPSATARVSMSTTSAPNGTFPFTVTATSGSLTRTLVGRVFAASALPLAPRLRIPMNGASTTGAQPELSWSPVERARRYQVQIASDAAFTTILLDREVDGTRLPVRDALPVGATLHWRVRALNPCAPSIWSTAANFSTGASVCATNIAIPDGDAVTGASSTVTLSDSAALDALDVVLEASHPRVTDLRFTLTQVSTGQTIRLVTRPNLCDGDDVALVLDEQSSNTLHCASATPTLNGRAKPHDSLSVFNGRLAAGDYTLRAFDDTSGETGSVTRWCVQPALKSELIFADGFGGSL
jgi:hypothetical protein